jgi:hypothetical protein
VTKRHSPKMTKQRTGLGFLSLLSRETERSTFDVRAHLRVSMCPSDAKSTDEWPPVVAVDAGPMGI